MEPNITLTAAITAAKTLFSAYEGYQRGKISETDEGIRDEIRRRSDMLRSHLENIHNIAYQEGMKGLRNEVQHTMESCNAVSDVAQFGSSYRSKGNPSIQGNLAKKRLKALVNHDLKTLELLAECVYNCNQLQDELIKGSNGEESIKMARHIQQKLTRVQNFLNDRNTVFDDLLRGA